MLKTKQVSDETVPPNVTRLYRTNIKVNAYNDKVLAQLGTTKLRTKCRDVAVADVPKDVKHKVLSSIPDNPQKTMGLFTKLFVGINQRVELCLNISVEDEMINGASGVIKQIESLQENDIHTIWVEFDDSSVGQALRLSKRQLYKPEISPLWTPVFRVGRQFRLGRNKNA